MIQGQAAKAATQDKVAQKERHRHSTDGTRCPVCGAEIDSRFEICPECGGKLVNYCTFCGADMDSRLQRCAAGWLSWKRNLKLQAPTSVRTVQRKEMSLFLKVPAG